MNRKKMEPNPFKIKFDRISYSQKIQKIIVLKAGN